MIFTKMHGLGNDYVLVDCFEQRLSEPARIARAVSDRHSGIGSDGLILICRSRKAVVRMEMYNADGTRAQMCGNGIRCVAKYAYDHGLTRALDFAIETDDGIKLAECGIADGRVRDVTIDMGEPRFAARDIPVNVEADEVIDTPIDINGRSVQMTCLSMGNPHAVIFVEGEKRSGIDSETGCPTRTSRSPPESTSDSFPMDPAVYGPALVKHALFPEGVNAHFVYVKSRDCTNMVTWERGSGPTRGCGTGACAVCVAAARTNRTGRRIRAESLGGALDLHWADNNHVYMTGPAVEVFTGHWPR